MAEWEGTEAESFSEMVECFEEVYYDEDGVFFALCTF